MPRLGPTKNYSSSAILLVSTQTTDAISVFIELGTQRAVQLNNEEDISSIYPMPEINPDTRHSALFLTSTAARR